MPSLPKATRAIAIVTTTVASAADAQRLAAGAVQARLAACVQVLAVRSHYRWQGALHEEPEWRLECKTWPGRVDALLAFLRERHPYELPELAAQTLQADPAYADWVRQETLAA